MEEEGNASSESPSTMTTGPQQARDFFLQATGATTAKTITRRRWTLNLAPTAADDQDESKQAQVQARERHREQQRLDQQRIAEEVFQTTKLQMRELQQQLAMGQDQQRRVQTLTDESIQSSAEEEEEAPIVPAIPITIDRAPSRIQRKFTLEPLEPNAISSILSEFAMDGGEDSSDSSEEEVSIDSSGHSRSGSEHSLDEEEGEELEEEKKETDQQQHLRRQRTPTATSSQKSNALPPKRRGTMENSEIHSSWKAHRRDDQGDRVVRPPTANFHSDNGRVDSQDEFPSFDWGRHRLQNNAYDSTSDPPKPANVLMGSNSEPHHTNPGIVSRRQRLPPPQPQRQLTNESEEPKTVTQHERDSLRSLHERHSSQQDLFRATMELIQQESDYILNDTDEDPASLHRRRMEQEPSPLQSLALQRKQKDARAWQEQERNLESRSPPPSTTTTSGPILPRNPRPKQPIFRAPSPPPARRQPKNLLDDMEFYNDDDEEEEDDEDRANRRRHQQNVLHLSSSWNDLFSSSNSSLHGQQQMSIPRRRGSNSSGGEDSGEVLLFEPETDDAAAPKEKQGVQDLEREARPTGTSTGTKKPQMELLHLSGSFTEFFETDEDDETDEAYDENYNKSIQSWKSNQSVGHSSDPTLGGGRDANASSSHLAQSFLNTSSGSSAAFDFLSHSSDNVSQILKKLQASQFPSSTSQYTSYDNCDAGELVKHLAKHGKKPPAFRWDGKMDLNASSHHGHTTLGATTITTINSRGRNNRPNPIKELRKSQRDKKKKKDDDEADDVGPTNEQHHHPKKSLSVEKEKAEEASRDKSQRLRSRGVGLEDHFEKSHHALGAIQVPSAGPSLAPTQQSSVLADTESAAEKVRPEKKPGSSPPRGGRTRRLPTREQRNRPGRTRSRSLSDLQRLKDGQGPVAAKPDPFVQRDEFRASAEETSSTGESVDDPIISKYMELVGDLLEQEKTAQAAAAAVKGVPLPPPPTPPPIPNNDDQQLDRSRRPVYNWAHPRSRRRASYDWMQHKTQDAAENMLALVGKDIVAAQKKDVDGFDDEVELLPPPVRQGGLERQQANSLTNMVISVDKNWKFDEKPDYDWSTFSSPDPILTSDSVLHFTGTTRSGAVSELLQQQQARRDMLTNERRPSFSSRSSISDVAAKKPMRRYMQLAQGVESKVSTEPDVQASYNWYQHSQSNLSSSFTVETPSMHGAGSSLFHMPSDAGSYLESDNDDGSFRFAQSETTARGSSLGAYLSASASAAQKSADEIVKIFDWTTALQEGKLDKSTIDGTGHSESDVRSGGKSSGVGAVVSASKPRRLLTMDDTASDLPATKPQRLLTMDLTASDIPATKPQRLPTMDLTAPDVPATKPRRLLTMDLTETTVLPDVEVGDESDDAPHDPVEKRQSLEEFMGSRSNLAKASQASVAEGTREPSVNTGEAVIVVEDALPKLEGNDAKGDKIGSRDRRNHAIQRTRSKSLTDATGRSRRRQKADGIPRMSRRRASLAQNRSMDKSLSDFLEKDKAALPKNASTSRRSRQSRLSGESTSTGRTSHSSGDPNSNQTRGRERDSAKQRHRSRSRSLTDIDKMKEKNTAKNAYRSGQASKTAGKLPGWDPGKDHNHHHSGLASSTDTNRTKEKDATKNGYRSGRASTTSGLQRGRDPGKESNRRRSRSRSLTDIDKMKQKDAATNRHRSGGVSMASGTHRGRDVGKASDRRRSRSRSLNEMDRMKTMQKSPGKLKGKTSHEGSRRQTLARTSRRLSTSLHLKAADPSDLTQSKGKPSEDGSRRHTVGSTSRKLGNSLQLQVRDPVDLAERETRGGGARRPRVQRQRSSSLSDMDALDRNQHEKRDITRQKHNPVRSGQHAVAPKKVEARRRRPERQRSRSLTDMGRSNRGGRKPEVSKDEAAPQRPGMLSSYNWQEHSASTRSMMSNSSKPQRDRRAMLVRTRSQSLSNLFGDKSRGHANTDESNTSRSPKGSRETYNWSRHNDSFSSTDSAPKTPRRHGSPNRAEEDLPQDPPQSPEKRHKNGVKTKDEALYDWNSHLSPSPGQGGPNRRDMMKRSRSQSLTDLVGMVNGTIEESPFENSSSQISFDTSDQSFTLWRTSLQASSGAQLSMEASSSFANDPHLSSPSKAIHLGANLISLAETGSVNPVPDENEKSTAESMITASENGVVEAIVGNAAS